MRRLRARTAIVVALALSVLLIGATTAPATASTAGSTHAVVHVQQAAVPVVHADNPPLPVPGLPPLPVPGGLPDLGQVIGTVMGLVTGLLKTITGLLGSVLPIPLPALPLPK